MGNLAARTPGSLDPRPFQVGSIEGSKGGPPVTASKLWLVNTGAMVSAITKDNADQFDLQPIGAPAVGTTGGGGMIVKTGLTTVFTVRDSFGVDRQVRCSLPVAVKPNNHGSEILGMDQLEQVNAKVRWDPVAREGDLYE
jgi:hypothetical protein